MTDDQQQSSQGKKFLSESLREAVIEKLISTIVEYAENDSSILYSLVEYGCPPIALIDDERLMEEYMSWHGGPLADNNSDDGLLRKMLEEYNSSLLS